MWVKDSALVADGIAICKESARINKITSIWEGQVSWKDSCSKIL